MHTDLYLKKKRAGAGEEQTPDGDVYFQHLQNQWQRIVLSLLPIKILLIT
jgi:hypothetical protein